mmetsp:Transcript_16427/g.57409  ORF Transcript_16427/g.57409 Transcript_16427/m.57409 type:complete len:252 (-) Transcript_16427:410-1165(-)
MVHVKPRGAALAADDALDHALGHEAREAVDGDGEVAEGILKLPDLTDLGALVQRDGRCLGILRRPGPHVGEPHQLAEIAELLELVRHEEGNQEGNHGHDDREAREDRERNRFRLPHLSLREPVIGLKVLHESVQAHDLRRVLRRGRADGVAPEQQPARGGAVLGDVILEGQVLAQKGQNHRESDEQQQHEFEGDGAGPGHRFRRQVRIVHLEHLHGTRAGIRVRDVAHGAGDIPHDAPLVRNEVRRTRTCH